MPAITTLAGGTIQIGGASAAATANASVQLQLQPVQIKVRPNVLPAG